MIIFKTLRFRNFLSFGNQFTEIQLDRNPTTLIVGENGSGKSTFLDAITFVLYGKPFRKIKKPQLVNAINMKNCEVECEFSINNTEYLIKRGIKPNKFEIYEDGELVDQEAIVRDYQEFLEKHILKMNYTAFTQVVVLGKATYVPFMRLKTTERRDIIEELLGLTIFSKMNEVLKQNNNALKHTLGNIEADIKVSHKQIELLKEYVKKKNEDKDVLIEKIDGDIDKQKYSYQGYDNELVELRNKRDKLFDQIGDRKKTETQVEELNKIKYGFDSKIKTLEKDIKFFESNDSCPTCSQEITIDFKEAKINANSTKIEKLNDGYSQLNERIDGAINRMNEIQDILDKVHDLDIEISRVNSLLSSCDTYIKQLLADKQKLLISGKEENVDIEKIDAVEKKYNELCEKRSSIKEKQGYYNLIGTMLKDNGIKSVIVNKYLPIFNNLINQYLTQMGFFVKFNLDESFNETILSRYKDKFSYSSFSEGEKLRIDLAILLTWREIAKLKNALNTNLLIMDEVFDSSLDQTGVDSFIELIPQMDGVNIFVISHTPNKLADKFRGAIRFEKHKNYSLLLGE